MMIGAIKNVIGDKNFGFIRDSQGVEYFFHRDDFQGHWDDLAEDFKNKKVTKLQFEPGNTPKGARASNVTRLDFPNQSR